MPDPQSQGTAQPQTLASMVRAKYPGVYDDMDDATLEQKVLAKYPQYSDLPRTPLAGRKMSTTPNYLAGMSDGQNGQNQYDPAQDPAFLKASRIDQINYLSSTDPDFAKASLDDKNGYINYLMGLPAPTTANNSAESAAPKPYFGFTPSNMASNAWTGVKQLASGVTGLAENVFDPRVPVIGNTTYRNGKIQVDRNSLLGTIGAGLPEQEQQARQLWAQPGIAPKVQAAGHEIASYLPFLGPWAAGLGQQAQTDPGGALARGGAQAAATAAAAPVLDAARTGVGMARESIGGAIHTPEGKLTPLGRAGAKTAGIVSGGWLGTLIGHPYAGGITGYELGPPLVEKMFPEPADIKAAREQSAAYEARAQDLIRRQRQQDVLDRQAANAAPQAQPFQGMPTTSPQDVARLPWMNQTFRVSPSDVNRPASPVTSTGPDVQMEIPGTPKARSIIQDPNSAPPGVRVTYQSVPQPDLLRMVRSGDSQAIAEWQRRGLALPDNVGFMVEGGAANLPWRRYRR